MGCGVAMALLGMVFVMHGLDGRSNNLQERFASVQGIARKSAAAAGSAEAQARVAIASVEERVLQLPEDGHQWHTILILSKNWKANQLERTVESMFQTDPILAGLKHQTHYHLITTDQAEFEPFRSVVTSTPFLCVELPDGHVVAKHSGQDLAQHLGNLPHALKREIGKKCKNGQCTPVYPTPPKPPAAGEPPVASMPAVLEEEPEGSKLEELVLCVVGLVAGGVLVVVMTLKKDMPGATS